MIGTKEFEEVIDTAGTECIVITWDIVGANLPALIDLTVVVGSLAILRT